VEVAGQALYKWIVRKVEVAGQARHDSRLVGEKEIIPAQGRNLPAQLRLI